MTVILAEDINVRIFATQTWANLVLKFRFQVLDRAKAIILRIHLSSIELTLLSSLLSEWTFDSLFHQWNPPFGSEIILTVYQTQL